jgi:hypothetical protein
MGEGKDFIDGIIARFIDFNSPLSESVFQDLRELKSRICKVYKMWKM